MTNLSLFNYDSEDFSAANLMPNVNKIIAVELEMKQKGAQFIIEYVRGFKDNWPVDQKSQISLLSSLASGNGFNGKPIKAGKKKLTSIKCNTKSILAIRLADSLNWRYASDSACAKLPKGNSFNTYFLGASRVSSDGSLVDIPPHVPMPAGIQTKLAVIFIDGENLAKQNIQGYIAHFNLQIEIAVVDSDGNTDWLPMIIDPDTRYPDGTDP